MRKRKKGFSIQRSLVFLSLLLLLLILLIRTSLFSFNTKRNETKKRRLPAVIVIGVRKGGTRALLDMMNLHSRIKTANYEIHFFDNNSNYEQGTKWYKRQMPFSLKEELTVEKTPSYFVTDLVPERIFKMNKSIALLLIVRDPVTRMISDYTQILQNHQSKNMSYKTLAQISLNEKGFVNEKYDGIERSIYVHYIQIWLKFFPLEQIHIVNGDKLISEPWKEIFKVESFLGLHHEIKQEHFVFNISKGFHCIANTKSGNKCLAKSKGRTHPNVSRILLQKLRHFFVPFNNQFYDVVHRDFGWPED